MIGGEEFQRPRKLSDGSVDIPHGGSGVMTVSIGGHDVVIRAVDWRARDKKTANAEILGPGGSLAKLNKKNPRAVILDGALEVNFWELE